MKPASGCAGPADDELGQRSGDERELRRSMVTDFICWVHLGASMSNQQGPRHASYALSPGSSSVALDTLYPGRERRPGRVSSRVQQERSRAPEAIWGQFNNYRSNGLMGSAIVHVAVLGLIPEWRYFRSSSGAAGSPEARDRNPHRAFAGVLRDASREKGCEWRRWRR